MKIEIMELTPEILDKALNEACAILAELCRLDVCPANDAVCPFYGEDRGCGDTKPGNWRSALLKEAANAE